jgi:hypothetical protein
MDSMYEIGCWLCGTRCDAERELIGTKIFSFCV